MVIVVSFRAGAPLRQAQDTPAEEALLKIENNFCEMESKSVAFCSGQQHVEMIMTIT